MNATQPAAWLLLLVFAAPATPQTPNDVEPADAYTLYSMLIPKQLNGSHFDRYAIAQQTVTKGWEIPAVPGRTAAKGVRDCVRVPSEGAPAYDSAISDFERKNRSSAALQAQFLLDRPYWLLNGVEVQSYRTRLLASWGFAPKEYKLDHRFDGGSELISASRVGFSEDGNVAIVYVEHFCGSTCGGGSLHVFRKSDGQWIEENRTSCGSWDS